MEEWRGFLQTYGHWILVESISFQSRLESWTEEAITWATVSITTITILLVPHQYISTGAVLQEAIPVGSLPTKMVEFVLWPVCPKWYLQCIKTKIHTLGHVVISFCNLKVAKTLQCSNQLYSFFTCKNNECFLTYSKV